MLSSLSKMGGFISFLSAELFILFYFFVFIELDV